MQSEPSFSIKNCVFSLTSLPLESQTSSIEQAIAHSLHLLLGKKSGKVFIDEQVDTAIVSVVCSYADEHNTNIVRGRYESFTPASDFCAVLVQLPNAFGSVEDYTYLAEDCHQAGVQLLLIQDLLAMALLRPIEADIVCGSLAPLGSDDWFVATREAQPAEAKSVALSHVDKEALSHLRAEAERVHSMATYLNEMMQAYDIHQDNAEFFHTLHTDIEDMEFITITPETDLDEMNDLIETLADYADAFPQFEDDEDAFLDLWNLDESHVRTDLPIS